MKDYITLESILCGLTFNFNEPSRISFGIKEALFSVRQICRHSHCDQSHVPALIGLYSPATV